MRRRLNVVAIGLVLAVTSISIYVLLTVLFNVGDSPALGLALLAGAAASVAYGMKTS